MPDRPNQIAKLDLDGLRFDQTQVLGRLRLCVAAGETLAILGPSGIGKTSLLRIIAGLEPRFEGHRDVTQSLAYVFQEPTLLPWRSALDNVTIPTGCDDATAREWLGRVGLAGHVGQFSGQLSLGQQRRLSLARAFAANPSLLLMDEPFVSLDTSLAEEMLTVFETLRSHHRTTTILVTHDTAEATRLADRIITLGGSPAVIEAESSTR